MLAENDVAEVLELGGKHPVTLLRQAGHNIEGVELFRQGVVESNLVLRQEA